MAEARVAFGGEVPSTSGLQQRRTRSLDALQETGSARHRRRGSCRLEALASRSSDTLLSVAHLPAKTRRKVRRRCGKDAGDLSPSHHHDSAGIIFFPSEDAVRPCGLFHKRRAAQAGEMERSDSGCSSPRSPYVSQVSTAVDPARSRVRQSRQLPRGLWAVLAFSLGIPAGRRWRLVGGTALYVLTLASCLLLGATSVFYMVFDILSERTRSTVFTGTADALLGICWLSLGPFANHLAYRVLTTPSLAGELRLHARRFMRVSAALILPLVAVAGLAMHLIAKAQQQLEEPCVQVGLPTLVCDLRYAAGAVYGLLMVFWNMVVAWCALSVCRSHTIACRRFIRELEFEATVAERIYDLRLAKRSKELLGLGGVPWEGSEPPPARPSTFMHEVEADDSDEETDSEPHPAAPGDEEAHAGTPQAPPAAQEPNAAAGEPLVALRGLGRHNARPHEACRCVDLPALFRKMEEQGVEDEAQFQRLLFTSEDICMRLWRISCRLRITSLVFQRWLATCLVFVAILALSDIVVWLTKAATFLDLARFFIPLLLMSLICTAYAEVNLESQRIVDSICPRPDRVNINRLYGAQPVFLTVYSMPLNYQVIAGVVVAFVIAFTSRIVMDELSKK